MAITTTWTISDMTRTEANGGVFLVRWQCVASSDSEIVYSATEGGKLTCTPDLEAEGFVAFEDLTEETVLGWVWNSVDKDAIEADRTAKVEAQIAKATANATGLPWVTSPASQTE